MAAAAVARQAVQAGSQAALGVWYQRIEGIQGDGTPFGRDNWNWMPSRPDNTTWVHAGTGALLDVLTLLCGPAWLVPAVGGAVINGVFAVRHYQALGKQGRATWGDVFWTAVGAVPVVGIVPSVVAVVGYDYIHRAEPSTPSGGGS